MKVSFIKVEQYVKHYNLFYLTKLSHTTYIRFKHEIKGNVRDADISP
jgi:hypothetical protein